MEVFFLSNDGSCNPLTGVELNIKYNDIIQRYRLSTHGTKSSVFLTKL